MIGKWLTGIFCLLLATAGNGQKRSLDYFLQQATDNSPLLKDLQNQRASLSLDSELIRAALKPQVNGISNDYFAPVISGFGYDEAITNKAQLQALIQVSKSFLSNKTIASQIGNLLIQSKTLSNSSQVTTQDLRKSIIDQYILAYGEQLDIDFNTKLLNRLEREDSLLKKLTRDNVYKQADYLAFVVTRQQQDLNVAQLRVQYNFDYATLNYLAGIADTSLVPLEDPSLSSEQLLGDYTKSIYYQQFVLDSLKYINDKAIVDITYRPKISAYADGGYNSSLQITPYKNFGVSAGLNLSVPIYDGKQRKLQYAKIDLQEKTRIAKRDFFLNQRNQQIMLLQQQLGATNGLIEKINRQVDYTETLITVNEKLLATGDIKLADFILTLNNYFNARHLVTQNYISRLKIISQLNYWAK